MYLQSVTIHKEKFPDEDCYPFNVQSMKTAGALQMNAPVVFFAGENGSGKSTLLEAVARSCNIYLWGECDTVHAHFNPHAARLNLYLSAQWQNGPIRGAFFGSQTFRHFAKVVEDWASSDPGILAYYGGTSLIEQSHGQSIMSFFNAIFGVRGLYLLDEPEAGLSPSTQIKLLDLISRCSNGISQFIIATHSPILLSCPGSIIYSFDKDSISRSNYQDTDHYRVYKDFFSTR
jgi:predicted ATPase